MASFRWHDVNKKVRGWRGTLEKRLDGPHADDDRLSVYSFRHQIRNDEVTLSTH